MIAIPLIECARNMVSKQSFLLLLILVTAGFIPEVPASADAGKISAFTAGFCDQYSSDHDSDTDDQHYHFSATLSYVIFISGIPSSFTAANPKTHYLHSPQTIRAPPILRTA